MTDAGGMEDAWRQFFRSLTAVQRSVSAFRATSQPDVVIRPALTNLATLAQVDRESSVDLQIATDEDIIFRNSHGFRSSYITDEIFPKRYEAHFDTGYNVTLRPYRQSGSAGVASGAFHDVAIPSDVRFTIYVDAYVSGVGEVTWRVEGANLAGTVSLTATKEHETSGAAALAITASTNKVRLTPNAAAPSSVIHYFLWVRPQAFVTAT